jgi:flagellin-like protein
MVSTKKNEEAVSPVIGVILMVAVTVILAAIIAAFVFGMAGNVKSTKVVAYTLERTNANTISATCMGGNDLPSLDIVTWQGADGGSSTVGTTIGSVSTATATSGTRVMLIGKFKDGTEQILLDKII